MPNWVIIEDEVVKTGSPSANDFVFIEGDLVTDTGDIDWATIEGNKIKAVTLQFDVTITSTNEPIEETETLTVDADITNNGDGQGTRTVTLSIDDSVGQVDSQDVTLSQGQTKSITLEWDTVDGDAKDTDYTATVDSTDDTATTAVTVNERPGDTATRIWSAGISSPRGLGGDNSKVYANADNSTVRAWDKATGTQQWSSSSGHDSGEHGEYGRGSYAFWADNGLVQFSAKVYEYSPQGGKRQETVSSTQAGNHHSITIGEYSNSDVIFIGSVNNVFAFEMGTGNELFSASTPESSVVDSMGYTSDILYFSHKGDDDLYGFELTDSKGNATTNLIGPKTVSGGVNTIEGINGDAIVVNGSGAVRGLFSGASTSWSTSITFNTARGSHLDGDRLWVVDQGFNVGDARVTAIDANDGSQEFRDALTGDSEDIHGDGTDVYILQRSRDEVRKYDTT